LKGKGIVCCTIFGAKTGAALFIYRRVVTARLAAFDRPETSASIASIG
jgi:hypothetical protein